MKKIYLCTLIVLSFLSCEPRYITEKKSSVSIVKVETLDERIKNTDSILNGNTTNGNTLEQLIYKNTEEILKNQIVIMKTLKELHK